MVPKVTTGGSVPIATARSTCFRLAGLHAHPNTPMTCMDKHSKACRCHCRSTAQHHAGGLLQGWERGKGHACHVRRHMHTNGCWHMPASALTCHTHQAGQPRASQAAHARSRAAQHENRLNWKEAETHSNWKGKARAAATCVVLSQSNLSKAHTKQ